MSHLTTVQLRVQQFWMRTLDRFQEERGDVPGWVLITLMTAMLVVILFGVAREQLVNIFRSALDAVTGQVTSR